MHAVCFVVNQYHFLMSTYGYCQLWDILAVAQVAGR